MSLSTKYAILGLQCSNTSKTNDPHYRVIGFTVERSEIPVMGLFTDQLEELCILFLEQRNYSVEKSK